MEDRGGFYQQMKIPIDPEGESGAILTDAKYRGKIIMK